MFERAIYRRSDQQSGFHVDAGQIAEAILYYGEVELLLDHANLGQLLDAIGHDALVRLVQLPSVKATLVSDNLATATTMQGFQSHSFVIFSLASDNPRRSQLSKEERVREVYKRKLGSDFRTRKRADFLSQFLESNSFDRGLAGKDLIESARLAVFDSEFMAQTARIVLQDLTPTIELPERLFVRSHDFNGSFIVETNVDFDYVSGEWSKHWPPEIGPPTVASILTEVLEAKAGLGLAAQMNADLFHTKTASRIIGRDLERIARSSDRFKGQAVEFNEWVLSGNSIASAINNGERTFLEFLEIVEEAENFKKWIVGVGNDKTIAREYFNEVSKRGWLEKLPSKTLRYLAFGGAGIALGAVASPVVGAASSMVLSAIDTFLLDRLVGGWKPNQFVDDKIRPFVSGKE